MIKKKLNVIPQSEHGQYLISIEKLSGAKKERILNI